MVDYLYEIKHYLANALEYSELISAELEEAKRSISQINEINEKLEEEIERLTKILDDNNLKY